MLSKISIEIINSLTISELDVLRFIDNNKSVILDYSIQNLAKETFVSTATIIRLCKKLGYSGFSELKYYIREEINHIEKYRKSATFDQILSHNVKSITETAAMLEEGKITEIVNKMLNREVKIHFFGKGLTSTVLDYASKQLLTYNRANFVYHDTHIAYLAAESMDENDLLFVASLSGYTHQVVRMAQIAKSRKACVVTISTNKENDLAKIGDYNFTVFEDVNRSERHDIASRIPILFILNVIITLYIDKKS